MRRIYFSLTFIALVFCTGCGNKSSCADEVMNPLGAGESTQYFDASMLLDEADYSDEMQDVVLPYLAERKRQGLLTTEQGSKIYYETYKADGICDTIVVFAGFREYTRKYDEAAYYFIKSGYNVCLFDHAGLGLSSRDKKIAGDKDATSLVYIGSFDTYVHDAAEVVEKVARHITDEAEGGTAKEVRLLLFTHSMGGCIGALYLEQYPDVFDKAVLSTPMLATNTGVPEWMAYSLSAVMDAVGNGAKKAVGQKTYKESLKSKAAPAFAESDARAAYKTYLRNGDEHYQANAATYSWTAEACRATRKAIKRRNVKKVKAPILMFQAEHDTRVRPVGQNRFRRRSAVTVLVYYPGVKHEIYDSRNEYLAPYYDRILRFYAGE